MNHLQKEDYEQTALSQLIFFKISVLFSLYQDPTMSYCVLHFSSL